VAILDSKEIQQYCPDFPAKIIFVSDKTTGCIKSTKSQPIPLQPEFNAFHQLKDCHVVQPFKHSTYKIAMDQ
jgi:hypothetical protein